MTFFSYPEYLYLIKNSCNCAIELRFPPICLKQYSLGHKMRDHLGLNTFWLPCRVPQLEVPCLNWLNFKNRNPVANDMLDCWKNRKIKYKIILFIWINYFIYFYMLVYFITSNELTRWRVRNCLRWRLGQNWIYFD